TTRTMNVNAGHERTSKARIIHQIQLIRGITKRRLPKAAYAYEPVCLRALQSIAAFRRFASRQHAARVEPLAVALSRQFTLCSQYRHRNFI
ncbi:hypothetical protein M2Y24_21760, partial [Klebsiella pneumoniae]|nr:hypothetical protein [Klebsiella pneumoniae]